MTEKNENKAFTPAKDMEYAEIIKPYQEAFSGPPWYEVSTCVDQELPQRCAGGLSNVAIGEICNRCGIKPLKPAYSPQELTTRFEEIAASRPASWYTEKIDSKVALAAVAWEANSKIIAEEKYSDIPEMAEWLAGQLGDEDSKFIWLDEVFANKSVRGSGNLKNFRAMCRGFSKELGNNLLAFRTKNEAMIFAAQRDFEGSVVVLRSSKTESQVPDDRDFIIIKIEEKLL